MTALDPAAIHPPNVRWRAVGVGAATTGQRRLDADSYLAEGHSLRQQFEALPGSVVLGDVAKIWQPQRLKGIQVTEAVGTPFLAAGQVFENRPRARKFLAVARTPRAVERFVGHGTILVSCSGTVGRATISHKPHEGSLITHDLLRVEPHDVRDKGWIYGFLRTQAASDMATHVHYGDVIKHLADHHLRAMPYFDAPVAAKRQMNDLLEGVLACRDLAWQQLIEAETLLADELLGSDVLPSLDRPFTVKASAVWSTRRRLDGYAHNPLAGAIADRIRERALKVEPLGEVATDIWWPPRFTRVFGARGLPYLSAESLFDVNRTPEKRILVSPQLDLGLYDVKENWILMARSGQIYGLNGSVAMATKEHAQAFISEDLIRIVADEKRIRPGYLYAYLGHQWLGRPLVIRHCYGTSVPHLEPDDVKTVPVPRLAAATEQRIAELAENATEARGEADRMENDLTARAEQLVGVYLGT